MAFDFDQERAVRRRTIPAPAAMSFNTSISFEKILKIGKEKFFPDFNCPLESFCLGDSCGVIYEIKDKSTWTLSNFVKEIGVPPSKVRLYIV